MKKTPLRYNISSWEQLPGCLSNNSTHLHIQVQCIMDDYRLQGKLIQVVHDKLGILFAYVVDATGELLSSQNSADYEMTVAEVLKQLERFGFFITYNRKNLLTDKQLDWLDTIDKLGYDKIRILNVFTIDQNTGAVNYVPHLVVFNVEPNSGWLDIKYSESRSTFLEAISNGSAVDLSSMLESSRFHWDWLDFVGNIQDILADNGYVSPSTKE